MRRNLVKSVKRQLETYQYIPGISYFTVSVVIIHVYTCNLYGIYCLATEHQSLIVRIDPSTTKARVVNYVCFCVSMI